MQNDRDLDRGEEVLTEAPTILCVVWNSSGSIVGTDLTFFTMGLYLKMHMLASVSELGVECMGRGVDRISKNVPSGLM